MRSILEYIMLNYTWLLGGAIIILLAIIGSYADKTNFGQGKDKETEKNDEEINIEGNQELNEIQSNSNDTKTETEEIKQSDLGQDHSENPIKESIDNTFEKFEKEFNELLPQKEIIDDELLDEIESLSLDKTQKINFTDIPDLDDVELPKIKSMPKEEDIWKF